MLKASTNGLSAGAHLRNPDLSTTVLQTEIPQPKAIRLRKFSHTKNGSWMLSSTLSIDLSHSISISTKPLFLSLLAVSGSSHSKRNRRK